MRNSTEITTRAAHEKNDASITSPTRVEATDEMIVSHTTTATGTIPVVATTQASYFTTKRATRAAATNVRVTLPNGRLSKNYWLDLASQRF